MQLKPKEKGQADSLCLSIPILKGCGYRGARVPYQTIETTRVDRHKVSTILFSPQSVTHVDLPRVYDLENEAMKMEGKEGSLTGKLFAEMPPLADLLSRYSEPQIFKTIVIDLTSRKDAISGLVRVLPENRAFLTRFLRDGLDKSDFYEMYNNVLRISAKEIEKILKDSGSSVKDSLVIFKTGWERFFDYGQDINHPRFEASHVALIHPYLDEQAVKYLVGTGVKGVGSDTFSLESSIFYFDPNACVPNVRDACQRIKEEMPAYKPLHFHFLCRGLYIIENLTNLSKIPTRDSSCTDGITTVCPYPVGVIDGPVEYQAVDALPICVHFQKCAVKPPSSGELR